MPSQRDHELEDEVCEDETHNNVLSHMCEMTAMEDDSLGFQLVQLIRHGFHGCHLAHMARYGVVSFILANFIHEFMITL